MLKIGSVTIPTNIISAPLAGCSDLAYRLIAREHGAKFCFLEMCDSNSLVRKAHANSDILKTSPSDTPLAGQLLGADPAMMLDAAHKLLDTVKVSTLDVNCACPSKKVIKKKAGAFLLKDPDKLSAVIKKLSSSLDIPVTAKLRIGYDKIDPEEAVFIARKCEDSGAAAIFVHGRTRAQGYMGEIHYPSIKAMKEAVSIPVIGSGNILNVEMAKRMIDETGCDGVLVARGGMGNPWLFKDIEDYLRNGIIPPVRFITEKCEVVKKHLRYIHELKLINTRSKVGSMRKVALWYLYNFPRAARVRESITGARKYESIVDIIDELPQLLCQCQ